MMPEKMDMFEEVKKILSKQLHKPVEAITLESKIKKDLGADSLDILQLLMKFEDEYGIAIPDEELAKFESVGEVVAFLDKQR